MTEKLRHFIWEIIWNGQTEILLLANDFRFSWINVLNPSTKAEYVDFLYIIKGAEEYSRHKGKLADVGIKAVNNKTLEITLTRPAMYFPLLLAHPVFFPVSERFYLGSKEDFGTRPETITSSGPYTLEENGIRIICLW